MKSPVIVLLLGLFCLGAVNGKSHGKGHKEDENVYSFGYGIDFLPFMDVNADDELYGFAYEVVNAICDAMHKRCTHTVYYDYPKNCWNGENTAPALNNGWFGVCVGYMETSLRASVYGFLAEFSREPESYVYVRVNSSITSLDDLDQDAAEIGFIDGWWTSETCLDRSDNINVGDKAVMFATPGDLKDALANGVVDAIFGPEDNIGGDDRLRQLTSSPIECANAGISMMLRKDKVYDYAWMENGLQKIRDSGLYAQLCSDAEANGDPNCL